MISKENLIEEKSHLDVDSTELEDDTVDVDVEQLTVLFKTS